ncbi:MAG: efflux system, rane fusion protein CmeA [Myxococcaceae bacterium]|nr:efflux system, rane fusion protein CmeA [Myxococcaceae bacterium]
MTFRSSVRIGLVAGALAITAAACGDTKKPPPPPPPTVLVAPVVRQDVAIFIEAVGTLDGYVNADIRARVKGYLKSQDYKDGSTVKEGQLLFTIEQAEYTTAVAAAHAAAARASAARTNARAALERNQELAPKGVVSKQELDNAVAADADSAGQVSAAQAALQQAELNLSYTQIKAPNGGVAGLALVRVGNLVGQDGPTLLTTVSQIDPIRVNFPMSEIDYVRFPDRLKRLDGRDLAWAKKQFPKLDAHDVAEGGDSGIELLLADGSLYPHRGLIVTANRQVDASTGTIQLQALFPNGEGLLRPGQYGRVRIRRDNEGKAALVVPEKALIAVQGTYSLGVVGPDNKVQLRRVELGSSVSGFRIIAKGVEEGERIVVEGQQKVADGTTVVPQPAPPSSLASAASAPPAGSASTARP